VLLKDEGCSYNVQLVDSSISMHPSSEQLEVIGYDSSTRIIDFDLAPPPVAVSQSEVTIASVGYDALASVQFLQQQLL